MNNNVLTVTGLNRLISNELNANPKLFTVTVEAEIGRITKHYSGHYYFLIKDSSSSIDCVMFKSSVARLKKDFNEGDKVILTGRIGTYEKNAKLQFYVNSVTTSGEGELLIQFNKLKEKLKEKGYFDEENKLDIPLYPTKIAVISSKTGAAIKDFLKVFRKRNPFCDIEFHNSTMQGDLVGSEIIKLLHKLESSDNELIVITRGGGSYEDLSAFNDEALAEAVFHYKVPIICAIGHEIDFTIAELCASKRGATPSHAGVLATEDVVSKLPEYQNFLYTYGLRIENTIDRIKNETENTIKTVTFLMEKNISASQQNIYHIYSENTNLFRNILNDNIKKLDFISEGIELNNPISILKKGYSITTRDGKNVSGIKLKKGDMITTRTKDIRIISSVEEIIHEGL